nr:hypothetical protein BaRGS_033408 [Batillaria attramentaria]
MDSDVTDRFSVMFMQFGQFIDHDMTAFPLPTEEDSTIKCCNKNGLHKRKSASHSDCFPIDVEDDSVFSSIRCMEFIRSVPAMNEEGNMIYPRENVNSVTSFVDGSLIYGSSEERMRELREDNGTGILLRTSFGGYLPLDRVDSCIRRRTSDPCFLAGDDRVNEQPGLTTLHTVFVRYHNHLAISLRNRRPGASDEFIFQRARAIVGATLQNILYGQWLPLVLGPAYMHRYGLTTGRTVQYNPDIDPRIVSVFSTSAFRFGHSMIPHTLHIGNRRARLRDLFNKPFEVFENLDLLAVGLVNATGLNQRAQRVDHHFAREITNHLFQPRDRPRQALDLVSLNIQRGRDHGLPSFSRFRQACGLPPVSSFQDTCLGNMGSTLQQLYSDVNDIDVFPGSMVEPRAEGAIVGPTIACLLSRQFHALKYGDRFYFETCSGHHGFSPRQMEELRKTSLAQVLCRTLQLSSVQRDVFQVAGPRNPMLSCGDIEADEPDLIVLANDT